MKKISAGLCPAPPNVTPQNLCLQGKLMPLTLRLALKINIVGDPYGLWAPKRGLGMCYRFCQEAQNR